jgi:hypothetical protein
MRKILEAIYHIRISHWLTPFLCVLEQKSEVDIDNSDRVFFYQVVEKLPAGAKMMCSLYHTMSFLEFHLKRSPAPATRFSGFWGSYSMSTQL